MCPRPLERPSAAIFLNSLKRGTWTSTRLCPRSRSIIAGSSGCASTPRPKKSVPLSGLMPSARHSNLPSFATRTRASSHSTTFSSSSGGGGRAAKSWTSSRALPTLSAPISFRVERPKGRVATAFIGCSVLRCSGLCEDGKRPLLDFVGRVERLEADFDHICAGVGLPAPGPSLDRLNVSDGSTPTSTRLNRIRVALGLRSTARGAAKTLETLQQAYAEEDIRRAVAERYACDFDAFGYALDVPAASLI